MRLAATVLNVLAFLLWCYLLLTEDVNDLPIVVCLIAANVSALLALRAVPAGGWLSLYFRRKQLEEQRRIEELERRPPPI